MASLQEAASMALAFVLFVVVVSIGGQVLAGVQSSQTSGTVAYNATTKGLEGIKNLADQSGTIGVILGASILIGILISAFYFSRR